MTQVGTSRSEADTADPGEPSGAGRWRARARSRGRGRDGDGGERGPQRRRNDRWKAMFVGLLVVGVLAAVAWVLLGSRLLVVRHVEVSGNALVPEDRVVAVSGLRLGRPMARIGTGDVAGRLEDLREVRSVSVERHWPATIRIEVTERVPIVAVERGGRYHRLDRQGVSVADGTARPVGLPSLSVAAPGPTDPTTLAALDVVHDLPDRLSRRLTHVEAPTADEITLRFSGLPGGGGSGGLTVVWGSAERTEDKIRLVEVLRRSKVGRSASTIDVSSPDVITTR